jgi:hypothetical protein
MNPDQTLNLNHNSAQCIKEAYKFGSTVYTNICSGKVSVVDWGGADWTFTIFLLIFGTALAIGALFFVASVIRFLIEEFTS